MLMLAGATLVGGIVVAAALWFDKGRARRGGWRVSERTLHTMELCGGWLGSLIARRVLRHKSRKSSYRLAAGAIAALHVAAWVALIGWAALANG